MPPPAPAAAQVLALDGLRALAVAFVVAFHLGVPGTGGGFVGVTVFLTLSGWLITTRALAERSRTGRFSARSFLARRARRLVPAAVVTVLGTLALAAAGWLPTDGTRADAVAALGDVANWRFALAGRSYADLFSAPSPFQQFWSLSVEEQWYLAFAVVAALAVHRRRDLAAVLTPLATVVAAGGFAAGLALHGRFGDALYYATPVRIAEISVGVAVAGATRRCRPLPAPAVDAVVVAAAAVVAVATWRAQVGPASLHLWLPAVAIATAAAVAAVAPVGPSRARRLLGTPALVAVGRRSYALYLVHWPVLLALTPERTGVDGAALAALRLAVSVAVAWLLHAAVEEPVRRRRVLASTRQAWATTAVVGAVVVAALVAWVPGGAPGLAGELAAARLDLPLLQSSFPAGAVPGVTPPPSPAAPSPDVAPASADRRTTDAPTSDPPTSDPSTMGVPANARPGRATVAVFGDSTAFMTGWGLVTWGRETGTLRLVGGVAALGCGIGRGGDHLVAGVVEAIDDRCEQWATAWPASVPGGRVDVAVVQDGPWEVTDRRLPGDATWRAPGDPTYDAYLTGELGQAMDVLRALSPDVVWLTSPTLRLVDTGAPVPAAARRQFDPARTARFDELVRAAAATRPGVHVVELGRWVDEREAAGDVLRPDGVHFTRETSRRVADWLGPQVRSTL